MPSQTTTHSRRHDGSASEAAGRLSEPVPLQLPTNGHQLHAVKMRAKCVLCVAAPLLLQLLLLAPRAGGTDGQVIDIMPMLLELMFEPHHRNFVKNLYENQMLVRCNSIRWAGLHRVPRRVC